jgi:site-specific recombinase XerD
MPFTCSLLLIFTVVRFRDMANVTFKLRTPRGTSPQIIYLVYRFGQNDKLAYSTGLKVSPQHWNEKKMRARDVVECLDKDTINNRLNELQNVTERFLTSIKAGTGILSKDSLKAFLDSYTNPATSSLNKFHTFITDYLKQNETRVNPKTGKIICYKVCREHARTYQYLQDFETSRRKGRKLEFEDINLDFYSDFTDYLQKLGLSVNTIGHKIQTLKAWLNEATDRGINHNQQYKSSRFKAITEDTDSIYLSNTELMQIYNCPLENVRLDRVRDLFLMGAFTGLRFSDFTAINESNIKEQVIKIEQQKTGKPVVIPLHPIILNIWNKYAGKLPPVISNQKFNQYIKEVCKLAGISTSEQKNQTRGGMRYRETFSKYELVGSHTARRSFATNLYLSGFPAMSIMQITGHKTETAFKKYIKVTAEQHADLLRKHWQETGEFLRVAK